MCWTTKPLVIAHRIEDANEVRDARTAADLPQRVERLTAPRDAHRRGGATGPVTGMACPGRQSDGQI
jgi:hypothetical protein